MPDDLAVIALPSTTALLLQELQEGVVGETSAFPELAAAARTTGIIERAIELADAARTVGVRVVHCTAENIPNGFGMNHNARLFAAARRRGAANTPGTESVRPIAGLGPKEDDLVFPRYHGLSPLTGSALDSLLRNDGVTTVVIVGVSLNLAIPNLVFDAVNRSYNVVVPTDAVAGLPTEYGEAVVQNTLRPIATLCSSPDLTAAWL